MNKAQETILKATAFAYGYNAVILTETNDWQYAERQQRLGRELRAAGCFQANGNLKEPYRQHQINGAFKAAEDIEGALETVCENCEGTGGFVETGNGVMQECPDCHGTGHILHSSED